MDIPYVYKQTLIKLDNLWLIYQGRTVIRDLCGEIKEVYVPGKVTGQVVGLLGPSGRGKTQTLRMLSGLQKPTSGQVLLADDKGFHPVQTGEVGVVAQNYPLFAHRTIMGNLMLAAKAHEPDEKKAEAMVLEGLNNFMLAGGTSAGRAVANFYPIQLSGGERQRVAILQMLICREQFILLDEPFASLDLINIEIALQTISHAASLNELNTFIVITHDVTAAVSICDNIWLLGYEKDEQGNAIPGARIVKTYDLLERGLCYEPGIITSPKAVDTIREIKEEFRLL